MEQQQLLADILARLTASEAANASLNAEVQRQAALGQQTQAQLVTTLSQLPAQLAQAVASGRPDPGQKSMIDARGLGKPRNFQNDEKDFIQWARKLENYVVSVHRNARTILAYATECTDAVDIDDCKLALPSIPVAEVDELEHGLHIVLMAVTEGESFDIVVAVPGRGLEAWRRLHKRWDPLSSGTSRGMLREILTPGKATLETLTGAIERMEDLTRRYCHRKDRRGVRNTLPEDIRMASLEALLPADLEKHVQLNAVRLDNYDALRAEVLLFIETRLGASYRQEKIVQGGGGGGSHAGSRADAMDVDTLEQKRVTDAGCYNCGGPHYARDCPKKGKDGGKAKGGGKTKGTVFGGGGSKSKGKGKGKKGGKGKGGNKM